VNHLNKVKAKLERSLDELEDSLEREKKIRSDIEKSKNKVEGDFKLSSEAVADLERNKKELEQAIQRKEKEISSISAKLEDESGLIAKLQRQIKELQVFTNACSIFCPILIFTSSLHLHFKVIYICTYISLTRHSLILIMYICIYNSDKLKIRNIKFSL
jgi:predicted nuclease with TOPRIM domain